MFYTKLLFQFSTLFFCIHLKGSKITKNIGRLGVGFYFLREHNIQTFATGTCAFAKKCLNLLRNLLIAAQYM